MDQNGQRNLSDRLVRYGLMAVASAAVLIVLAITAFIAGNSIPALAEINLFDFIAGSEWKPSQGLYGAGSIILGSLLVTVGAMIISIPMGVGAAIYMSEIASRNTKNRLRPVIELFAGIPSVVYGFFGLMVVVPALAGLFPDQTPSGFSWIAGSLILGLMALPTIVSISEDALDAIPHTYREASLALGATEWETISKTVVPAALPGIVSAIILGIGRAIGETMAVMMVTGNAALVPDPLWNVFSFVRTITSTLALEIPEVVVGSAHYSALFLLGLVLMIITLAIDLSAKYIVRRVSMKEHETSRMADVIGERGTRIAKEAFVTAMVLVLAFMVSSLFLPVAQALAVSAIFTLLAIASKHTLRRASRMTKQKIMHSALFLTVAMCVLAIVVILGDIVVNAIPALSWEFLTQYPIYAGASGGILPAIVGTLELIAGTAAIAIPIGVLSGTYLAEYSKKGRFTSIIESSIEVLNGTPSIVFALFGMSAIVMMLGLGVSLLSGCVTLALMILPVIIKTTEEAVGNVPMDIREASFALGANKWQTTFKVVLPAALGGIMTGAILGLGRAAGETAPIMFTAAVLMKYSIGFDVLDPVMALPYHLYYLASEGVADPSMQYATALVLLAIVCSMFLLANIIRNRSNKNSNW